MGACLDIGFMMMVPDPDGLSHPRAHALRVLQNAIATEDYFRIIAVEGGREPLFRHAQLGRVRL
jgi:hypothetical protein